MPPAAASPPASHDLEAISLIGFVHGVSHFFHLLLPPLFPWLMNLNSSVNPRQVRDLGEPQA